MPNNVLSYRPILGGEITPFIIKRLNTDCGVERRYMRNYYRPSSSCFGSLSELPDSLKKK